MKKGVVISIALSIVLTLTLAITTLVSMFGGKTPDLQAYYAYRTGDVCLELKDYNSIDFNFNTNESSSMLVYNQAEDALVATNEGTCVVKAVNKNGRNCEVKIQVFTQGVGTETSPWVIANAKNLQEFSTLANAGDAIILGTDFVCEFKADVDMTGKSYIPAGNQENRFKGTINGNGKTIKNLQINVTTDNYADYVTTSSNEASLDLGLIGNTNGATINNLSLDKMSVSVADDVKATIEANLPTGATLLRRISVGSLVGAASNTIIDGNNNALINSQINAYSFGHDDDDAQGVGGVVGIAYKTTITKYSVDATITANQSATLTNNYNYYGAVAGNAFGNSSVKSNINNLKVKANFAMVYNNKAKVGGVAGYVDYCDIQDIEISKIVATGNEFFAQDIVEELPEYGSSFGAVAYGLTNNATLSNVKVLDANVNVKSDVAGLVVVNGGKITNCTVKGEFTGYVVSGAVSTNYSTGIIEYSNDFNAIAIDVILKGIRASGVVDTNRGIVNGGTNKARINTIIRTPAGNVNDEDVADAIKYSFVSGVCAKALDGEIKYLTVNTSIADGVNMAGIANNVENSSINNITANVNLTSCNLSNNTSTTYAIAGAVNYAKNGANISDNTVVINANQNVFANHYYGASEVGGLVSRIYENGVTINNNTVSGNIFVNYTKQEVIIESVRHAKLLVGGLIGSISAYGTGSFDACSLMSVASTIITNNTIDGLNIKISNNDACVVEGAMNIRAVGSLIGYIGNTDALNISTNVISGITLSAPSGLFGFSDGDQYYDSNKTGVYGGATNLVTITGISRSNILYR